MPRRKKRSRAQMEACDRCNDTLDRNRRKRRSSGLQAELYDTQMRFRKSELKKAQRGRATTIAMFFLLFIMIINSQLLDGLTRWESVNNIARLSNKSPGRLSQNYNHYIKTGNILVPHK